MNQTAKPKMFIKPQIIPREKWLEARRLAGAHGGYGLAYDALSATADADPQVLRVLDHARHGGKGPQS